MSQNKRSDKKHKHQHYSDFLATVSHELRTPLLAMQETLSQLDKKFKMPDQPQFKEYLQILKRNSTRMAWLLNDLFDLSKLERGHMGFQRQKDNLNYLIDESVKSFQAMAEKKGIELKWTMPAEPTMVFVDHGRMLQVFQNLLSNALKFVHTDGYIEIKVSKSDQEVKVSVEDSGSGVDQKDRERIFEKFVQADKTASKQSGSGLGLTISRHILKYHQGDIWLDETNKKGARFMFSLPLYSPALESQAAFMQLFAEADQCKQGLGFIVFHVTPNDKAHKETLLTQAHDILHRLVSNNIRSDDVCRWYETQYLVAGIKNVTRKDIENIQKRLWHILLHQPFSKRVQLKSAILMYPEDANQLTDVIVKAKENFIEHRSAPREYELSKRSTTAA